MEASVKMLRYHDYHLQKYEVSDYGKTIKLSLGYGYSGEESDFSEITFEDVSLYNFVHTEHSIITDIEEVSVISLFEEEKNRIENWNRLQGITHWKNDTESTAKHLKSKGYKGWYIDSAIGFSGFIVAKSVKGT